MLGYVLDMFDDLPKIDEAIFIIGYLGDQIKAYVEQAYPALKTRFVHQEEMLGQSHAIWLAREGLEGPMLMAFVDTLIETDFSALPTEQAQAVAWVRRVPDPRRFGVAELGAEGKVQRLIEKPDDMRNNLAVIGFYYFQKAEALVAAIVEQMHRDIQLKGEYFLADAINILLEQDLDMRVEEIEVWHDCGTPEAILDAHRYVLDNLRENSDQAAARQGVQVLPPVYVDPAAEVSESVIGPYASIGAGCVVERSEIKDSIIDDSTTILDSHLSSSLVGHQARIDGCTLPIIVGDNSVIGPT
jgi:glucose-1-phosphate thymidylyltransferase